MNKKLNKQKGFSLPSVIVGSIIAAILSGVAISSMWESVDNSKVVTIASLLKEQVVLFESQPKYDYDSLNTDGNQNYLPEIINAGMLSPIPLNLFEDPSSLTWEIRKIEVDGYRDIYYSYVSTSNPHDDELISKAIEKLNLNNDRIIKE